jgi:adenosylcobinamide-GDP ribazoletransferase
MLSDIITAIRTLTILPVPGKDTNRKSNTLPWFPFVGCLLGIILFGLAKLFNAISGNWFEGTAVLIIAGSAFLTRGIHMDGLADFADGFGGGKNESHTLSIMKDSNVGAFGILAAILVLLFKYVSLLRILQMGNIHQILAIYIISRMMMVPIAVILPYARAKGGTANPFVNNANVYHLAGATFIGLILIFAFNGILGCILVIPGCIISLFLGIWFYRRLHGVTGDLFGACCEISETVLLFFCASIGQLLVEQFSGRGILLWSL